MADGPASFTLFESILPERAIETDDPVWTKQELEAMDYDELRQLAAETDSDAVNGKSTKLEIIGFFARKTSYEELADDET